MLSSWLSAVVARCRPFSRGAAIAFALLTAACSAPLPMPPPMDIPHGHGRLWQVDHPGAPPSYIFGTMHVTDPRVYALPQAVETAFTEADIAIFEVDYRRPMSLEKRRQYIELPKGQSLEDVIGSSTYRDLRRLIFRHRLPLYNYFREQPWVSWVALSGREISIGQTESPEKPILDDWLIVRARKANREVDFLETAQEQWQSFAGIPMDDQVAMLRSAIETYYDGRLRVDRVAVYVEGNLALSYALWEHSLSHLGPVLARQYTDRLLNERNHRMVERMLPYFERHSAFVAVGALHLPGEEGVLRLLEQRGYTLTRLQ
ncbi:TraB/GumN family protein [Pelagibius sp. 7325]|uniref:TraB/GumN family protein n=1 Tax=Pelagibius sp. 7325 TaxID=3131994 RepID=UPI0030EC9294